MSQYRRIRRHHFELLEKRHLLAGDLWVIAESEPGNVPEPPTIDIFKVTHVVDEVDNPDEVSLRDAIEAVNAIGGGTITFDKSLADKTIQLTGGQLKITAVGTTVITGPSGGHVTIDANDQSRVLLVSSPGSNVTLSNLKVVDGKTKSSDKNGGGISFLSGGTLMLVDVIVASNQAVPSGVGGGIYTDSGDLWLVNATVTSNVAGDNNSSLASSGGGIFSRSGDVTIESSQIRFNKGGSGGGIAMQHGDLMVTNSAFTYNDSRGDGGGIYLVNGTAMIADSTVSGNSAESGGGIYAGEVGSRLELLRSTIDANKTEGLGGGGINCDRCQLTSNDSAIYKNRTSIFGRGGGVHVLSGELNFNNTTVFGNSADRLSGGISADQSDVSLQNVTIVGNSGADFNSRGGLYVRTIGEDDQLTIHNTLIAGNSGNGNSEVGLFVDSDFVDVKNTLVGNRYIVGISDQVNGNIVGVDWRKVIETNDLGNAILKDHGGPTLTVALVANTEFPDRDALDGGGTTRVAFDQRGNGFRRIADGDGDGVATVDIGAFEAQKPPNSPTISIEATFANKNELDNQPQFFFFTVTREGEAIGPITVDYSVSGDGANPADFADFGGAFPAGTLSLAEFEMSKAIRIAVNGDAMFEPDETFVVTLGNATNAEIGTASALATILNDDPSILSIFETSSTQREGDSTTTNFSFTVNRTGDQSNSASVNFQTQGAGSSPANEDDFGGAFPDGSIEFASGEASKVINIAVSGDTEYEPDELFIITLSGANGASLGKTTAIGSIRNDDDPELMFDFGDAAHPYPVMLAENGARHRVDVDATLFLGLTVDSEVDGQPDATAGQSGGGDDNFGNDDEDGVLQISSFLAEAEGGSRASVSVIASGRGLLDAWIDFNQDGVWGENDQIAEKVLVVGGANMIGFDLPPNAVAGPTAARFRISSVGGLAPTGEAADGEVEDYEFVIEPVRNASGVVQLVHSGHVVISISQDKLIVQSQHGVLFQSRQASLGSLQINGSDDADTFILSESIDDVFAQLRFDGGAGHDTIEFDGAGRRILLSRGTADLIREIEVIDLRGSGPNSLFLEDERLTESISGKADLTLLVDPDESLTFYEPFQITSNYVDNGTLYVVAENGNNRVNIGGARWTNPLDRYDVDANAKVTASDALAVINALARGGFGQTSSSRLVDPADLSMFPSRFFDVNGDGDLSASDALVVINVLARLHAAAGESVLPIAANMRFTDSVNLDRSGDDASEHTPGIDVSMASTGNWIPVTTVTRRPFPTYAESVSERDDGENGIAELDSVQNEEEVWSRRL